MQPTAPGADPPLLSYLLATRPTPLLAGDSETSPAPGTVHIVVTPPATPVYCTTIAVAVPATTKDGGTRFPKVPKASSDSSRWPSTSIGGPDQEGYYQITFTNQDPKNAVGPVTLSLTGNLVGAGQLTFYLQEDSTATQDAGALEPRTRRRKSFRLSVSSPTLYLTNVLASTPGSTIPRTEFTRNEEIQVSWESNGTYFRLSDGQGTELYQGTDLSYQLSGGLSRSTTLTLVASTSAAKGFDAIQEYAGLSLTVADPQFTDLTVGSPGSQKCTTVGIEGLHIDGSVETTDGATVNGGLTVAGQTQANGDLVVRYGNDLKMTTAGLTGVQAPYLNSTGSLDVNATLTVSGQALLNGDATVGYGGNVKMNTSGVDGVEFPAKLSAKGGSAFWGLVDLFSSAEVLPNPDNDTSKYFEAPTSGILIASVFINTPGDYGAVAVEAGNGWLFGAYNGNSGNGVTVALTKGQGCHYYMNL